MSTKRIHLVLTTEQAGAVVAALDLYARMGIGQVREIANLVRAGSIPFATKPASFDDEMRRLDEIDAMTRQIAKSLGFGPNASLGIGNQRVPIAAHRAYEIEKVLDKALADDRDPDPSFRDVRYDGLSVRYTDDPAPVARAERAEESGVAPCSTALPPSALDAIGAYGSAKADHANDVAMPHAWQNLIEAIKTWARQMNAQARASSEDASAGAVASETLLRAASMLQNCAAMIRAGGLASENPDVWDCVEDQADHAECLALADALVAGAR